MREQDLRRLPSVWRRRTAVSGPTVALGLLLLAWLVPPAHAQQSEAGEEVPPVATASDAADPDAAEAAPAEVDLSDLVPPVLKSSISPPVPDELLPEGGPPVQVVLTLQIDETGSVVGQWVSESSGYVDLDEAVLSVVPWLEFLPARYKGETVSVSLDFPFRFLPREPQPPPVIPARLSGRVEARGSREGLGFVPLTLVPAIPKPEEDWVKPRKRDGLLDESVNYLLGEGDLSSVDSAADGRFLFEDIPPGPWFVVVGSGAYRKDKWLEILGEGADREVIYRLKPTLAAETTVIGRREPGAPERELSREDLFKIPGGGNDPGEAIRSLPGVSHSPPQGASGPVGTVDQTPVVRGAAAEDSVAVLDGLPSPILIHSVGTQTVLGDHVASRAYLKPAAAEAEFGDLTGGVVGLDVRSPRSDRIGGFVQPGLSLAAGAIEGPIGPKARFYVGFRRSYYEVFFSLVLPPDSPIDFATVPFLQDQQAILEADLAPWLRFQFAYLGTIDGIDVLSRPDDDGQQEQFFKRNTTMNRFQIKLDQEAPNGFTNRFQPAVTFWGTEFKFGELFNTTDQHTTVHLLDKAKLPLFPWLTLKTGALLEVDVVGRSAIAPRFAREDTGPEVALDDDRVRRGREDVTRVWFGGWLAPEFRPAKWLRISPQVRFDYYGAIEDGAVQPRGVVSFIPTPWMTWTIAGGRYVQLPSLDELNAITGNPELASEQAWHVNLGLNLRPAHWLDIDIQGYAKFLENQVVANSSADTFADLLDVEALGAAEEDPTNGLSNDGVGRIYGMEVFARFAVTGVIGLNGWVGYSLSWSERKDFEGEDWRWFSNDRRHQLTILARIQLPKEISIGGRWLMQTGRPRTPVENSIFYADTGTFIPVYGDLYSERSSIYHQLDLRLDQKFRRKNVVVNFFIEVTNVYYAKTDDFLIPSFDYREQAGFALIPSVDVGFRLEF